MLIVELTGTGVIVSEELYLRLAFTAAELEAEE